MASRHNSGNEVDFFRVEINILGVYKDPFVEIVEGGPAVNAQPIVDPAGVKISPAPLAEPGRRRLLALGLAPPGVALCRR